jgi:hypothetical protein
MLFEQNQAALTLYHKGDQLRALGKITRVEAEQVTLNDCELLA